jgi:hypothetical protein
MLRTIIYVYKSKIIVRKRYMSPHEFLEHMSKRIAQSRFKRSMV